MRYDCKHEDKIDYFGWNENNGKDYGKQDIRDIENNIDLVTEYVELEDNNYGLRVSGYPLRDDYVFESKNISLFFAVSVQGDNTEFSYSRLTKKMIKNVFKLYNRVLVVILHFMVILKILVIFQFIYQKKIIIIH